jgi:hypothetical protein
VGPGREPVAGSCDHGNEHSDCIKGGEVSQGLTKGLRVSGRTLLNAVS